MCERPDGRQTVSAGCVCCCSSLEFPLAAPSLSCLSKEAESSPVIRRVVPSSPSTTRAAGEGGGR